MKSGFHVLLLLLITALPVQAELTNSSGPWGVDAASFKNLSTALASPSTFGKTVLISTPMAINSKTTDRAITLTAGGKINVFSDRVLAVNGPFSAGRFQVFTGGGKVVFGANQFVTYPEWWGAKGNGVENDSVPIQNAINALIMGGEVSFPQGRFKCSNIVMKDRVTIVGVNNSQTIFKPASDAPVFKIGSDHILYFGWKRLTIDGTDTKSIYSEQDGINISPAPGKWAESIVVEDVTIKNSGRRGWYSRGTGSSGQFVQRLFMNRVLVQGSTQEGIWLDGAHFETTFRDVWSAANGNKTVYPNTRFGSVGGASGPQRLTWIGGGIMQTNMNQDVRYVTDAAITAGTKTLKSATAAFTAKDVGTPVVISLVGIGYAPAHIATIAGYVNPSTVTLSNKCPVTVTNGKALINTPTSGGIAISHSSSINFIGVEFEECGAYLVVNGTDTQNISVTGSSFISNKPSMAALWVNGYMGGKVNFTDWALSPSQPILWGAMCSQQDGSYNGAVWGLNIETPMHSGKIVNSLTHLFDFSYAISGVAFFDVTDIPILRLDGASGPVETISQRYNNANNVTTTGYKNGQLVTILAYGSALVIKHNVGNIVLKGGTDYALAIAQYAPYISNRITLMWDAYYNKWVEIARSE